MQTPICGYRRKKGVEEKWKSIQMFEFVGTDLHFSDGKS